MNDTPTPRTDAKQKLKDIIGDEYVAVDFARQLERELTAAREELAELKEEYGTWWAQKRIAIDELKEVTEQRDRLAEALRQCREDSVELLGERNWWKNEPRLGYQKRYQETRDNVTRADEALQSLNQPTQW